MGCMRTCCARLSMLQSGYCHWRLCRMGQEPLHGSPTRKGFAQLAHTNGVSDLNLMSSILSNVCLLDLSENPLGVNGAKVLAELLDLELTPHQFIKSLRLNKVCAAHATSERLGADSAL